MEVHDGQNENPLSLLVNRVDHSIGKVVNQATAVLMVRNGSHTWVRLDSLNCCDYLNGTLIAKTWLAAFKNLHQFNQRRISAKTSSLATGLTVPV
jgi:hypothetical protein